MFQESKDQHGLGFCSHIMEEESLRGGKVWPGKSSSGSLGGTFEERWEINGMVKFAT